MRREDHALGWLVWSAPAAVLLVAACARQEAPPGGEVDRLPPVVIAVRPEALSTVEPSREPIVIEFNERISEQPATGTLQDAVTVSPHTGDVEVDHTRRALEVEVVGGFVPGVVYRVTVRPVVRDMFNNTLREPFEFGFSTGGEFHETALAGLVVDRVSGRPMHDLVVRALRQGDTVAHVARTDSGVYTMRWLPPGEYSLVAFQDRNRDYLVDPTEPQGSRELALGPTDTVFLDFPVLEPDTTPPQLTRAEVVDSATLRLTFSDYLDPDVSLARVGTAIEPREEAEPAPPAPQVRQLLHEHRWLALLAARDSARRVQDSLATLADTLAPPADTLAPAAPPPGAPPPDTLAPDSLAADTAAADTAAARAAALSGPALLYQGRAPGADSASAALLGLTLPSRVIYAELADTLPSGVEFVLRIQGVVNLAGLASGADSALFTREAPEEVPPPPGQAARDPARPATGGGGEPPQAGGPHPGLPGPPREPRGRPGAALLERAALPARPRALLAPA